ncbi:hypothetical protein [Chromobacterium alticapitis]|uniref:hypothetical protein n=1 Tax=Chromobacterium alticapitis TaxID=2073169 RepID=UPI0011B0788C|nr:hypothetical protein [Chromobacterium alticapitis]
MEVNSADIDVNKILVMDEVERAWGSSLVSISRVAFDLNDVPSDLHILAPYATFWGVADDWAREDVLKRTPERLKNNFKWVVSSFDDQLDAWLAGPEASRSDPTDAYIAFSAMRMGADFI